MSASLSQTVAAPSLQGLRWRRRAAYIQDAVLVVIAGLFCYVHARHVAEGTWTSLPFAVQQGLLVGIFLCRRRSVATSTRPRDWAVAAIGGWLPLAMQVEDGASGAVAAIGVPIQMAGLMLTILCFGWLGRSFGIVAANRGLKTRGPYALVRHPIYLAHVVTDVGFILVNVNPVNFLILAVAWPAQLLRIHAEERVLTSSSEYAAYRSRVRWRLFPRLF